MSTKTALTVPTRSGCTAWKSLEIANNDKSKKLRSIANEKLCFGHRFHCHRDSSIVTVTVDRPMGSVHPKHRDIFYPINYGYVEGITVPDGEWQDAYILGVDEPIQEFTGKVIGVIHRLDDVEDKWVVCPENMSFSEKEITEKTDFQEKFFKTEILV